MLANTETDSELGSKYHTIRPVGAAAHLWAGAPGAVRATLPAFVYQAGNFLASYNGPFQAKIAEGAGGDYGYALALVGGAVAVAIAIVIRFSPERRGQTLQAH